MRKPFPVRQMKGHVIFEHLSEKVEIEGIEYPRTTQVHQKNVKSLPNDWKKNWKLSAGPKTITKPQLPADGNDTLPPQESTKENEGNNGEGGLGQAQGDNKKQTGGGEVGGQKEKTSTTEDDKGQGQETAGAGAGAGANKVKTASVKKAATKKSTTKKTTPKKTTTTSRRAKAKARTSKK